MRIQGYSKMKTLLSILLIIIGLIIIVLSITKKTFRIDINRQTPPMTKQEIVKFCQELFANTTRDDFSYPTCLKELKGEDGTILKI